MNEHIIFSLVHKDTGATTYRLIESGDSIIEQIYDQNGNHKVQNILTKEQAILLSKYVLLRYGLIDPAQFENM